MPPRELPVPDSLQANPDTARLLTDLINMGTIKATEKASDWKNHPTYS